MLHCSVNADGQSQIAAKACSALKLAYRKHSLRLGGSFARSAWVLVHTTTARGNEATDAVAMNTPAIDAYLAKAAASSLRGEDAPAWPDDCTGREAVVAQRIAFHGIALLIAKSPLARAGWPETLVTVIREQAGIQTFWEQSHRPAIARLIEGLAAAGIRSIVTKGTALAYSVYGDPALRRRGDTDIYIPDAPRDEARKVLRACGFRATGGTRALQEDWVAETTLGFKPAVDVHWRINASGAVSQALEGGLRFDQTVALGRLEPQARGLGPVDNLILIAINRSAHGQFGYIVGDSLLYETDRLIWALDAHLLAATFSGDDWASLADRAARTGTAPMVAGILALATRVFGTDVPHETATALREAPTQDGIAAYYGAKSHLWRLQRDIAACNSFSEKAKVLGYAFFPSEDFLRNRYPDAQHWPRPALHARRLFEGAGKLLTGRI